MSLGHSDPHIRGTHREPVVTSSGQGVAGEGRRQCEKGKLPEEELTSPPTCVSSPEEGVAAQAQPGAQEATLTGGFSSSSPQAFWILAPWSLIP